MPPTARRPECAGRETKAGRGEQAFAIVSLVVLAGGVLPLIQKDNTGDTNSLSLAAFAACCVAAGAILQTRGTGILVSFTRLDFAVVLLLGVIALSVFWSDQPGVTVRRAAAVLLYTVFGLYLLDRFPIREHPWLLARACGVAAIASVAVALLVPRYGVLPGRPSEWRGIFVQKNVLGRVMAVGVLASVISTLMPSTTRRRQISAAIAAGCVLVLLRSASVSAVVSMLTVVLPILALLLMRTRFPVRQAIVVPVVAASAVCIALVATHWDSTLAAVGRNSGLTGRVQLWSSCWDALLHRPWFGYGYGAFWHGWSPPSSNVFLENPWGPPNAHNGPLDLALGVGVVGAGLWVLVLVVSIGRAVRALDQRPSFASLWPLALPLLIVIYNVTEVTTTSNGLFWALLVAASTSLFAAAREQVVRPVRTTRFRPHASRPSAPRPA